jgi:hypothetical protein
MPRVRHLPALHDQPWDATTRDLTMDRIPVYDPDAGGIVAVRRRWNLPQEIWPIDGVEMSWGSDHVGGQVAAINILDRYLGLPREETSTYWGVELPCAGACITLAWPCYRDILQPIGWWGGVISGAQILQWIAAHRRELDQWGIDLVAEGPDLPTLIY